MNFLEQINDLISARLRRSKGNYQRALSEFSRTLTLIVDFDQLVESLIGKLREIEHIPKIIILLRDAETNLFSVAECRGAENNEEIASMQFDPEDTLVSWLKINEIPLILSESPGVVRYLSENERAVLERSGIEIVFPLLVMNRVTGMVLLGGKESGEKFSKDELDLLTTLLGQSALAFENALLYQEQKQRLRKMYRADRLATIGQMAAGAAHEIRNPLTSIRSTIQYLQKDLRDAENEEIVQGLLEEVDRINEIINGLLSFAKPTEAHIEEFDLAELLQQTVALIHTAAKKQRVEVAVQLPENSSAVEADQAQLKQVFLNILMNALQAMTEGGRITIVLNRAKSPGADPSGEYMLEIKDTGPGIDTADLELVFDPFFTTKTDGTGLGLSITYGIVQRHGGTIEVDNYKEGAVSGARVVLRLPARSPKNE